MNKDNIRRCFSAAQLGLKLQLCSRYVRKVNRRSTPQRKTDDAAFPVRVFLRVPEEGLGKRMDVLHQWLADNLGRGEYAVHAGGRHLGGDVLEDRLAVYTRHPGVAVALLDALPDLDLSDGTESVVYSSSSMPFGRRRRSREEP